MLNMQNVKDIEITEGNVRTVHDKDSRLIWGRLAYDTKYAGDTYQQTYSGKNLFNKSMAPTVSGGGDNTVTETATGVRITVNTAGTYSFRGWIVGKVSDYLNKTLTLSANVSKSADGVRPNMYIGYCNNVGGARKPVGIVAGVGEKSCSAQISEVDADGREYIIVALYGTEGTTAPIGDYSQYDDVQLQIGEVTAYEPYTGGIPAPNPDYPQDIQVVTGEQNVWVHGKNMFNKDTELGRSNVASKTITGSTIKIENTANGNSYYSFLIPDGAELLGKTCTISFGQVNTYNHATGAVGRFAIHQTNTSAGYYANNAIVPVRNITSNYNYTFTFPDSFASGQNGILLLLYVSQFGSSNRTGDYAEFSDVQIELGSTPSSYESYVASQSYTVDLGSIELCKIGDYRDYIYNSGDDWYVHKEVGKYIFDGSESWTAGIYGTNSWILANVIMTQYDTAKTQILSTKFRGIDNDDRDTSGDNVIYTASNYQVWIRNTNLTSLSDVQTATAGTPAYYRLATATDTKITDTTLVGQLEAVHEWLTRYGYSGAVTGDLPIIINQTNL